MSKIKQPNIMKILMNLTNLANSAIQGNNVYFSMVWTPKKKKKSIVGPLNPEASFKD